VTSTAKASQASLYDGPDMNCPQLVMALMMAAQITVIAIKLPSHFTIINEGDNNDNGSCDDELVILCEQCTSTFG
jgi:hypothetical protein